MSDSKNNQSPPRSALKIWHRRIGALAALFVLLLALTGILLNHTSSLKLDQRVMHSGLVLGWYGIDLPEETKGLVVNEHWIAAVGERLFWNRLPLGSCTGGLVGAVSQSITGQVVVACQEEIFILTATGALIERLNGNSGVPTPIRNVFGYQGEILLLVGTQKNNLQHFSFNPDTLESPPVVVPLERSPGLGEANLVAVPATLHNFLAPFASGDELTFERLVQDIHSGRILGAWGVYLMDVMAALFILLAISGLIMSRRVVN